jgi:hypothetical protein
MRKTFLSALLAVLLVSSTGEFSSAGPPNDPYLLQIQKNGRVLHAPMLHATFWGVEWSDAAFYGDIISGIDVLLSGYSGSEYASTLNEYYDRTGVITGYTTYAGHLLDSSPSPAPGGMTPNVAFSKVCSITGNNPDPNAVYFVFPSTPKASEAPGSACGFHAAGACSNRKPLQVIGVPYTTGAIGSGCEGVQDTTTGHSLALAQIANLAMHELAETMTDPRNDGWHDGYGEEVGNKCILTFPSDPSNYPVFPDGSRWKLQGLWSNAAFLNGSGAPNRSGQKACVWH